MPSFVTHVLFGQMVKDSLCDSPVFSWIDSNPAAYEWGTQGPDILFSHGGFSGKPDVLEEYGRYFHEQKTSELIHKMSCYLINQKDTENFLPSASYIFGFLCHYVLDKTVHPYVYYMQEKFRPQYRSSVPYGIHLRLESDLDTAFFHLITKEDVRHFPMNKGLMADQMARSAAENLYVFLLKEVYHGDFSAEDIRLCFNNFYRKERVMLDPTGFFSFIFAKSLELVHRQLNTYCASFRLGKITYDILNLEHRTWKHFREPEVFHNESVPDLICHAVPEACQFILQMTDCIQKGEPFFQEEMLPLDDGNPLKYLSEEKQEDVK